MNTSCVACDSSLFQREGECILLSRKFSRSVPFLEASSDDVVAKLAQVFDRRVRLGHLINLGVPGIAEGRRSSCLILRIRCWLLLLGIRQSLGGIESTF